MVLAMASVLFVGCTTPPTPDPDPDPTPTPVVVVSATPVLTAVETSAAVSIFDVTSTSTLYMNKAEVGTSILVKGTAPSESLVQLFLGDVAITPAVGEATVTGLWTIAVAKSSLGDDGVKVLTAKVTEVGLAQSVASNVVTFTLDTDLPGISSVAFSANSAVAAATWTAVSVTTSTLANFTVSGTTDPVVTVVAGTWTISSIANSGVDNNILVTSPSGAGTYYNVSDSAVVKNTMIPGVTVTFGSILASYADVTYTISSLTAATGLIAGRATIKFDENVDYTGMSAGTYAGGLVSADPGVYNETVNTGYWTSVAGITAGTSYTINVYGITDLAGNAGGTSASPLTASAAAGTASATSLAP